MQINNQISNEEREITKTGEDVGVAEEKTAIGIPQDKTEAKTIDNTVEKTLTRSMTPTEIAQKTHYEKEAIKNEAKAKLFDTIKICAKVLSIILGLAITVGTIFLSYYISSISEPMGALKKSVENIEETNGELKDRMKTVENKLSETREEFILKTKPINAKGK